MKIAIQLLLLPITLSSFKTSELFADAATSYNFKTMGGVILGDKDFGFDNFDIHQTTKKQMIVRDVNEPSSMPTSIPSGGEPSSNPTGIPTIDQTTSPSSSPTIDPTTSPSSSPTSIPSGGEPSSMPTSIPTIDPTTSPTTSPTIDQTTSPSSIPTIDQTTYTPTVEPTPAPSEPPTSTLNSGSTDSEPVDNTGLIIVITIPIVIIFAYAAYCGFVKYNSYLHRVAPSEVTEQNIKNIKRIVPM